MAQRYALLDATTKQIMDVKEWDGKSAWITPDGMQVYMIPEDLYVEIGWQYVQETNSFLKTINSTPGTNVRKIAKIDFMRLFTTTETVRYKLLRLQIANLTEADYMAAVGGDAIKMALVQADVFFDRFDLASEVEMDHPETIVAVNMLGQIGIFGKAPDVTAEHIASRVSQVLAGLSPTPVPVDSEPEEPEPEEPDNSSD